jgi:hypothetical protein
LPLRKIFQVNELEDVHKRILDKMVEEKSYSTNEIKGLIDGETGDPIDLRALNRHLEYLERKNYIDSDGRDPKTWKKIRDVPLALEVLEARIYERRVASRMEALWGFYLEHLDEDRPSYDKYARAYKEAMRAKRMAWVQEQEARRTMKSIQEKRRKTSGGPEDHQVVEN